LKTPALIKDCGIQHHSTKYKRDGGDEKVTEFHKISSSLGNHFDSTESVVREGQDSVFDSPQYRKNSKYENRNPKQIPNRSFGSELPKTDHAIKKDANQFDLRLFESVFGSMIRTGKPLRSLAATTASARSWCTARSWLAAWSWLAAITAVSTAEASLLAWIDRNFDAGQFVSSDAFGYSHEFFGRATAFIGNANALQAANFLLNGNTCQFFACFYATRSWIGATAILSGAHHRATQSDTHDRGEYKFEHSVSL
jgi:hypothetical protein